MVGDLVLVSKVRLANFPGRGSLECMRGWSINLFRIRGIQISLHYLFFVLPAFVSYYGWRDGGAQGVFWATRLSWAISSAFSFTSSATHSQA